jgi:hypothetical protein
MLELYKKMEYPFNKCFTGSELCKILFNNNFEMRLEELLERYRMKGKFCELTDLMEQLASCFEDKIIVFEKEIKKFVEILKFKNYRELKVRLTEFGKLKTKDYIMIANKFPQLERSVLELFKRN